jgi:copper homeostasis protein (lipoprotein)
MNLKLPMPARAITIALAITLALAACKPQPEAETAAAPPAPEPLATPVAEPVAPDASGLDTKAFAGTFSGTLPCADCPGIDTTIHFTPDGAFTLQETYQDRQDGAGGFDGTWTSEADGRHVRLDPDSKSEDDRLYEVVSIDEIRMLDTRGEPIESELDYSLRRSASTE